MALGLALVGCDLTQVKKADDNTTQPATAETVIGIWRTSIPVPSNPPTDIKVTMEVLKDGTSVTTQSVATGQPAPAPEFVEISKENWTWKVENGTMLSVKTTCEYKDPATMQPTGETACRQPLTRSDAISVKGKAWSVVQGGEAVIFLKD